MKESMSNPVKDMTERAFGIWEDTVRSGLKMQEEAFKSRPGKYIRAMEEMQSQFGRFKEMTEDLSPAMQKRADEILELIDKNTKLGNQLSQLASEASKMPMVAEQQSKWMDYWKLAVGGLYSNAEALVQIEARTMIGWIDFAKKSCESR